MQLGRRSLTFLATSALLCGNAISAEISLEEGFRSPPPAARPHTYWLWLNGHVHAPTATEELAAMKDAGLGGVLLFEMGARGDPATIPTPGPAFLSEAWVKQLRDTAMQTKVLGLQLDMSVISSWDMGGPWIEPKHAVMGLYATEINATSTGKIDIALPFPQAERAAPLDAEGRPAFWKDIAVLAVRDAKRLPSHEFILRLDHKSTNELTAVVFDQGTTNAPAALAQTMTPVREVSVSVSDGGLRSQDFNEVLRTTLRPEPGPQRISLPAGTRAEYVRLTLHSGHDESRPRWTLAEFEVHDSTGQNVFLSHRADQRRDGGRIVRGPVPLTYTGWSGGKLHDGLTSGAGGVFSTAGRPSFDIADTSDAVDVTAYVDRSGQLRWNAPAGSWTILRYVCMVTGEKLKVPSPASDGLASDHLNPEATRIHMNHVIAQLRTGLGPDLSKSGIENLYLASYEVVGLVWSPVFAGEFRKRRGYDLTRWIPAIFGARVGGDEMTSRFLFDYRKTLGEVVVDAYYRTAVEVARAAGLKIKSEAGGPGPPIHTPPIDALLANGAVDNVQGEFWPFWPDNDAINVIKETASAAHIYGKPRVHLEAFTSFSHWAEGPQDLKPSADRVFTEGGNHFVWHTWTHQAPGFGLPGLVYGAGTHLNRSVTWWPKAKPFLEYLARGSFMLQRGHFVGDVLYYYGDGGMNFVLPRKNPKGLGPGYDYDVTNAEVILNRLSVKKGRLTTPEGTSYAMIVLPEGEEIHPPVLEKLDHLVKDGAILLGSKPQRATGLQGHPHSDARVRQLANQIWGDLDGKTKTHRKHGRGQVFFGVTERSVLEQLKIGPDFTAPDSLDFTHRRDGEDDIYFIRNKSSAPTQATAIFRSNGRSSEFWDPQSGTIQKLAVNREAPNRQSVALSLPPHGAGFVVFRGNPTPSATTPKPAQTSSPVRSLALDENWTVTFQSQLGDAATLTLPQVAPWTKQTDPAWRYFPGSGKYKRSVVLPAGWRTGTKRIELDLGKLWSIGEVWINGVSHGVIWAAPFAVDCTQALRDGENEIVVEVIGTWQNRLIGEARGELPKKTKTNISVSEKRPWKDREVIESGLFGPVRLLAY